MILSRTVRRPEPNGNVLVMTSPGIFGTGGQFFEWNGTKVTSVNVQ
jgi:hypothetical protein